jgi:DnaJ-domain-containing protein 1
VRRDVTQNELTARYRQLLRANHPDKVAQLDPTIQAFATDRVRKIIEAYEAIAAGL